MSSRHARRVLPCEAARIQYTLKPAVSLHNYILISINYWAESWQRVRISDALHHGKHNLHDQVLEVERERALVAILYVQGSLVFHLHHQFRA